MGKSWKNPIKAEKAAKKGALFTKFAREIQVAARMGGADITYNSRLRLAVDVAKKNAVPNETIDRAIKKGAGLIEGAQIEELVYEGYGPHGVGVIVESQTDNRNRTASDLRSLFKSHDGSLGESGSVSWMFEHVSMVQAHREGTFDPEEEAIEVGANEVHAHDGDYEFISAIESLDEIKKSLTARGWKIISAGLGYTPKNVTELDPEQKKAVMEFLTELDDHEDVQKVSATVGSLDAS